MDADTGSPHGLERIVRTKPDVPGAGDGRQLATDGLQSPEGATGFGQPVVKCCG